MKYLLSILSVLSIGLIFAGVVLEFIYADKTTAGKFYGTGIFMLFFICMPIFLYSRRNSPHLNNLFNQYKTNQNGKS